MTGHVTSLGLGRRGLVDARTAADSFRTLHAHSWGFSFQPALVDPCYVLDVVLRHVDHTGECDSGDPTCSVIVLRKEGR